MIQRKINWNIRFPPRNNTHPSYTATHTFKEHVVSREHILSHLLLQLIAEIVHKTLWVYPVKVELYT